MDPYPSAAPARSQRSWQVSSVLVLAVIVGLLQMLPTLFLKHAVERTGSTFLILQVPLTDSTIFYLPRAREIVDGHFPVSDLHIPANKHLPWILPPGPQVLFAAFIKLAGDVTTGYMAASLVFTVFLFLLFYWLGRVFTGRHLGALVTALVGVFTPAAYHLPRAFFSPQLFLDIIGKNFVPLVRTPIHQLFLARIEDPLFTLWLYLIAFILLYRFWQAQTIARAAAFGLAAGLLLYFYLLYWIPIGILAAILFAVRLARRGPKRMLPWFVAAAIIALAAVPYLSNFLTLKSLGLAAEQSARVDFEYGRGLRLSVWRDYLVYAILAIAAFLGLWRRERRTFLFFAAALAALFLVWNLQLFLGWNLPPDHWTKVAGVPILALASVLTRRGVEALSIRFGPRTFKIALSAFGIVLLLLLVSKKVVNAFTFVSPPPAIVASYSFDPAITASWHWMNGHVPPEAVVLSNSFLTSAYLIGYTGTNAYLAFGSNTIAPTHEVEERFLTVHKLFGTTPERLAALLVYRKDPTVGCPRPCDSHTALNLAKAPTYLYNQSYNVVKKRFDALLQPSSYAILPEKRAELVERYGALHPRWENFRGVYVYVGPWERELSPAVDFRREPSLELVYERDGIEIYRVRSGIPNDSN